MDLHEWIPTLNSIDAALSHYVQTYPNLLLVAPIERKEPSAIEAAPASEITAPKYAESLKDAESVPDTIVPALCSILRFLSGLLCNSTNKAVFNSVEEVVDLLAAKDDNLAILALQTLSNLATAPCLHKQQAPEGHQHTTALHTSHSHKRLVPLARGWGSRGSGLGLYACVTADDSEYGHGDLPVEAGEIRFEFFAPEDAAMDVDGEKAVDNSKLVSIHLTTKDIVTVPVNSVDWMDSETAGKKQKRQRTGMEDVHPRGMLTRSTAELFFQCLDAAGGRDRIPEDRLFVLLADIRLSKSFHSAAARVAAIESRLLALITILHAHPSQDIMSGYFQAQPELCVELIDLLRPTVSSGTVSAASTKPGGSSIRAIEALACPPEVPYEIRYLAVEALTALVARRDGASGGLTGVARQSNILNELGVGKGMYLGLLPTLVRYSLASLNNFLTSSKNVSVEETNSQEEEDVALDIGLAFLQATKPPLVSEKDQIMRAVKFVDNLLSLTSAVVSAPSGTAALTDCGIIPALLSTVALGSKTLPKALSTLNAVFTASDQSRIYAHVRFIASQAIQIIEGAIVTHNNALSAFHDLKGVDILITRLEEEMITAKEERDEESSQAVPMETDDKSGARKLVASRRVLLFSIVNCLTVVFHQESTTSSHTPNGGAQLRKPELTFALTEVMQHIESYGGVLAALTCSLLSDVMNSDPHVVYHVHKSGMAKAFFDMMASDRIQGGVSEPAIPTVPELIMALPNVIAALSLTAEGATQVKEANPFPSMLRVLFHQKYAMPRSRCLLNEMTAIVGTGLDEVMRHVPSLRALVMESIVKSMNEVIELGKALVEREEQTSPSDEQDAGATTLENDRTCLMQYTLNLGQMLEQILHTEDHCDPFVEQGGLTAILDLFQLLVPPTTQFLANACCLSSPSVSTLSHTTTEDSLTISFRCIAINYDSQKMLKIIAKTLNTGMDRIGETQRLVRETFPSESQVQSASVDAFGVLDGMPREAIYELRKQSDYMKKAKCLADYLRSVVTLQWQTNLFATVIRAACQRSQDGGTGWGRAEREWKKELSSDSFETLISRLSEFHHSAILESCRVRSDDGFESDFRKRHTKVDASVESIRYRLRIVCQEGAVVRDGIEIDSCNNIGSMEMGEVADAYERCVNSSGVMRYRTRRGWVSELTRGHGREPIAEVMDVSTIDTSKVPKAPKITKAHNPKKRMEYHVASFCNVGASILARLQTSYRELFSSLSRVVSNGVRSLPVRTMSFQSGTVGAHTQTLLKAMASSLSSAMNHQNIVSIMNGGQCNDPLMNKGGAAMYLGALLGIISSSLYEDKRERRTVNVALLIALVSVDNHFWTGVSPVLLSRDVDKPSELPAVGLFDAIKFVMEYSLQSVSSLRSETNVSGTSSPVQSLNRITAASLPPVIAILRRLMAGVPIKQSPVTSILDRIELADLATLIGGSKENLLNNLFCRFDDSDKKFSPERFVRAIHFGVADMVLDVWKDQRFRSMPPHVVHPMTTLSIEIIGGLEDVVKPSSSSSTTTNAAGLTGRSFFGRIGRVPSRQREAEQQRNEAAEQAFEPSEDAISRLMEMGFSRDHALDAIENTESNRLEVAMEYALSHPPPSPGTVERRREQREESRRQREAQSNTNENAAEPNDDAMEESGDVDADTINSEDAVSGKGEESRKKAAAKEDEASESRVVGMVQSCLDEWVDSSPSVAISLLADCSSLYTNANPAAEDGSGKGDADTEALTVVVCSFLINLCQKYPDKSDVIVRELLLQLKQNFTEVKDGDRTVYRVEKGSELRVSALAHSSVLFARAIPRTRTLVLEQGLVTCLMSCLNDFVASLDQPEITAKTHWPVWLAPSILLLDIMAQPLVAFPESDEDKTDDKSSQEIGHELEVVKSEHRQKAANLSEMADQLFSALSKTKREVQQNEGNKSPKSEAKKNPGDKPSSASEMATPAKATKTKTPFSTVPPFFPLIPDDMAKTAMKFCMRILGKDSTSREGRNPPPGTVHATLLLLTRLLRSSSLATDCLREGAPDLILALPRECRFNGNAGLVTVVLRRLLEDETNLTNAMETEIRSVCAKLHRKQSRQGSSSDEPAAPLNSFLQAVTPLLCRDPWTFLKAVVSTVSFESKTTSSGQKMVTLLSQDERQRNIRTLSAIKFQQRPSDGMVETNKKSKGSTQRKISKGKSPHRVSLTRRGSFSKKKKEKNDSGLNGTPSNHIMSLLVENMISLSYMSDSSTGDNRGSFGEEVSFLWVADILEIMADLVLAVPACAAAIHRFRPAPSKGDQSNDHALTRLTHAVAGCPPPPPTVVNFLLHRLLSQDRWSYRQDQDIWDRRDQQDESRKRKNKESYMKTKVAQTTARLLVALVARAGEGRRRVVADLSFALSVGRQKRAGNSAAASKTTPSEVSTSDEVELFALQAWGDLCIGLAAPRSNGVNHDNNSNLSYEVVKLMLDFKMAHSLLYAVGCVNLKHPMAASACGSLLVPLEVFTRGTVSDAVQALADKEKSEKEKPTKTTGSAMADKGEKTEKNRLSLGPSGRVETAFADDSMLADGFDAEAASSQHHDDDDDEEEDSDDEVVMEVLQDDGVVIEDVHMEDQSDEDDIDSHEDEMDSDDEDDSDDDDDESDSEDDDDDESGDDDDDEREIDDDDEEIEEDDDENLGTWDEEGQYEFFDDVEEEEAEEEDQGRSENDLDDWDQIEAPPFGGMMLGGRRRGGNLSSRARGFVDAAEAMIGSLLRTGEIQGDALAEIEGTLGIRIAGNRNLPDWMERGRNMFGSPNDGRQRQGGNRNSSDSNNVLGTVPHVNQRRPPDVGYSGPGGGGRWNDISSIEFVFGGPTLTGGSRNFDVVSEVQPRDNGETYALPSAVDSQLFPGGPAASTHARTQQAFHPLLCGVDLPPVNSLVSDLPSHGERSTRRGEISTRRSDGWASLAVSSNAGGYMISTPNGNLMRVSRGQGQLGAASRAAATTGLVGWTDDGQPFDGTVGNFSTAFETAINETIQQQNDAAQSEENAEAVDASAENAEMEANDEREGGNAERNNGAAEGGEERGNSSMGTEDDDAPQAGETDTSDPMSDVEPQQPSEGTGPVDSLDVESGNTGGAAADDPAEIAEVAPPSTERETGTALSDGEDVAPSLVEGLRLSDSVVECAGNTREEVTEGAEETSSPLEEAQGSGAAEISAANEPSQPESSSGSGDTAENEPNANGFVCPPGMDLEVFNSLPQEMQGEVVDQHQATLELAAQLDATSGLDPEALAALPEDMRREVIAHEQRERRLRESAPADPSNAEEMDNASFVASLAPELRREILLTADETFLNSLPPDIIAEAQILRERASHQQRRLQDPMVQGGADGGPPEGNRGQGAEDGNAAASTSRRKPRYGKMKVECDRSPVLYLSGLDPSSPTEPIGSYELKSLIQLMFLLSPVRPQRLLQKVFQNISANSAVRCVISSAFTRMLNDDSSGTRAAVDTLESTDQKKEEEGQGLDFDFPPMSLIGATPEVLDGGGMNPNEMFFRRRQGSSCAASIAANLPTTLRGSNSQRQMPPVVSTRVIDTLTFLSKNSPRVCLDMLTNSMVGVAGHDQSAAGTCFEQILDLLRKPRYIKSSTNLEHLLAMIEIMIYPLTSLSRAEDEDSEVSSKDIEAAAAAGKEWVDIPRIVVSQSRLQLLCSILKMESCRDAAFTKVNGITCRLCKVEANRGHVLGELASVAQALGEDAKRDLRALLVRMNDAVSLQPKATETKEEDNDGATGHDALSGSSPSSTVTLSNSSSELKLLRVLQTLQSLCSDSAIEESSRRKNDTTLFVTAELIDILQGINLNELWDQLSSCLKVVRVLEGIATADEVEEKNGGDDEEMAEDNANANEETVDEGSESVINAGKKLQNSSAGLLTRFLPAIEAFFVVNASATREEETESAAASTADDKAIQGPSSLASIEPKESKTEPDGSTLVGGNKVIAFVSENKVILNALVRNNSVLLEKGLRAMVQVPRCRAFLDFDVKRQWFKTQIRRLRQQASRRHGSLRLGIRRKHVFEDAYHQLRLRNADEMRSRLHITFRNEEGVDAGGLSREFFGILAKEMFNPNYALFTSTEDGCTFQPNPNSSINPDHLSYFRFVGRIVGKAVADGFLLDAHFTRSLYKHMLGLEPTHHDMEAIDPDYYKNLKMIMEYSLADIGLELTFSTNDISFGRNQVIDLIPDGRNILVTDDTKAKYVSLVCKHRMTDSIKSQIKAYLDGFYELVSRDLIAVFTPRELELLISGLPDIDVSDLKANTDYQGWKATDPEMEWFWKIMQNLSRNEKAAFLQFVTGSAKVPLAGFAELQGMRGVQKFSIHKAGGSSGALMSAHTCFNSLDLPKYESETEMKEKLLYAISEGQGSFMFA